MLAAWFIPIGVLFISLLLTPLIRYLAMKWHLVDMPNERSSHKRPTPRGGGLAIVVSYLTGLVILCFLHDISFYFVLTLTISGIVVAAVGLIDDHLNLAARWRIIVHFAVAVWIVFFLNGYLASRDVSIIGWFLNLFWVISIVWFINLYNFMDGIDTMASAEAIFVGAAATVLFIISGALSMALAAALLTAAVGGFLFWNLPPARIFMGDVGSGFIGVVIGIIALAGMKHGLVNVWVWLILSGIFLIDATITVGRRIVSGEKWYSAHRSHAYQHAVRRLESHGKVTVIVTGINVFWLFPWAIVAFKWPSLGLLCFILSYIPLILLAINLGAGRSDLTCSGNVCFEASSERSVIPK